MERAVPIAIFWVHLLAALEQQIGRLRSSVGNLEAGQILSSPALLEERMGALEVIHADGIREDAGIGHGFLIDLIGKAAGDKRNAPWLEVWGSTTRLYSALTMAAALGMPYDYVREKLSDYLATDEPVEVAEPSGFSTRAPGRR